MDDKENSSVNSHYKFSSELILKKIIVGAPPRPNMLQNPILRTLFPYELFDSFEHDFERKMWWINIKNGYSFLIRFLLRVILVRNFQESDKVQGFTDFLREKSSRIGLHHLKSFTPGHLLALL